MFVTACLAGALLLLAAPPVPPPTPAAPPVPSAPAVKGAPAVPAVPAVPAAAAAKAARAAKKGVRVYVNGVEVTHAAKNKHLRQVSVRFDHQGNLHVDAPAYDVKVKQGPTPECHVQMRPGAQAGAKRPVMPPTIVRPPGPAPKLRYFATLRGQDASIVGCRIQVLVNGNPVASLTGLETVRFKEITAGLSQGRHQLGFRVRRPPEAAPDPNTIGRKRLRDAYLEIEVGPGAVNGPSVKLDRVQAKLRCTDRTRGFEEKIFPIDVE